MKFEFIYDPVYIIIIRDIFSKEDNEAILEESIENKNKFEHSVIGSGKKPDFRSNRVSYYDTIYETDRTKSKLLSSIDTLFSTDEQFREVIISSPNPLNLFTHLNFHETQVSRYGDEGQQYKYHIDSFDDETRQITIVYYFHEEPKKYTGGEISFTRSPIYEGNAMDTNETPIIITPENNMMVVFGAHTPHMVLPTISPKEFNKGRFSVNCWVGKK